MKMGEMVNQIETTPKIIINRQDHAEDLISELKVMTIIQSDIMKN